MKLRIRSLFLKIFFWYWATVIATGIALVITWIILQPRNLPPPSQRNLADTAWISGAAAVNQVEQRGAAAATAYLAQIDQKTHLKSCLFDLAGNVVAGSDCGSLRDIGSRVPPSDAPVFRTRHNFVRVAVKLHGSGR